MLFGGQLTDTILQITATVVAGAVLVGIVAAVRFTMHVRDSVREQDEVLESIGNAVNHTPPGEPNLYDLVMEGVEHSLESIRQIKVLKKDLAAVRHTTDDRLAAVQTRTDRKTDELRGIVIDLRDKVEELSAKVEAASHPDPPQII
jgi:hypothetical protein